MIDPIEDMLDEVARLDSHLQGASPYEQQRRWLRAAKDFRCFCMRQSGLACCKCNGEGSLLYGDTSTWRGGMAAQAITRGICDHCWGTGRSDKAGPDLRALDSQIKEARTNNGRDWFVKRLGLDWDVVQAGLPQVIDKLERARWKGGHFAQRVPEYLVALLKELLKEEKENA